MIGSFPADEQRTEALLLELAGGAKLALPPTLGAITTYVLLEQEGWFEKECRLVFTWLKPGMNVVDIGANLGVYAVPATHAVAPGGSVYAYEPASEPRGFLRQSRAANRLSNLEIIDSALSDSVREAVLVHGTSSELHSLTGTGGGERVAVTTLDAEETARGWSSPDFVKIDAEGEEARIVEGGRNFFGKHSPLVMFEIKSGETANLDLAGSFAALGYRLFRLIGGAPLLVPFVADESLDPFELNLFAAKAERAAELAAKNFLIENVPEWTPDAAALEKALAVPRSLPFASPFAPLFDAPASLDPDYRAALAGFALWRSPGRPMAERYAALLFAERELDGLCRRRPSLALLSTLARASWETGKRFQAVLALYAIADAFRRGSADLDRPFWPANPRFDMIDPANRLQEWFFGGTMEQLVRAERHSSLYGPPPIDLSILAENPFVSPEMTRRRVLRALRAGGPSAVPRILLEKSEGHINAALWRSREVPGL